MSLALLLLPACKPASALPSSSLKKEVALQPSDLFKESAYKKSSTSSCPQEEAPENQAFNPAQSLLRLNATQQSPLYQTPWLQGAPHTFRGLAVLLDNHLLLSTAEMVADAKFISLVTPDNTRSFPAKVVAVDYNANLALLRPKNDEDKVFLESMIPIQIAKESPKKQEELDLWQLLDDGSAQETEGKVKSFIMASSSPIGAKFLLTEIKAAISDGSNSFTLPAFKGDKLTGLLALYDKKNQMAQFIDCSVMEKFVSDATQGNYEGFSELEIEEDSTLDPAFRQYLKLTDDMGGIYVKRLRQCGNAYKGGLRAGDVILALDAHPVSSQGYVDIPPYGKVDWSYIIRAQKKVGDTLELLIRRNGENQTLRFPLEKTVAQNAIEPHLYDKKVPYINHGGMIFIELSMPYLMSFGDDWYSKAPVELVNLLKQANEKQEKEEPDKIVILSGCIPTSATLGYERLGALVVKEVNGEKIQSLKALSQALKKPQEGLHEIKVTKKPYTLYLSEEEAKKVNVFLQNEEGIHAL